MFNYYFATCFLLKCVVTSELLEDKQQIKFGVMMKVRQCMNLVEPTDQNNLNRSKNDKEIPKNKEQITKYEEST